jgi:hypothetical protein
MPRLPKQPPVDISREALAAVAEVEARHHKEMAHMLGMVPGMEEYAQKTLKSAAELEILAGHPVEVPEETLREIEAQTPLGLIQEIAEILKREAKEPPLAKAPKPIQGEATTEPKSRFEREDLV